MNLPQRGNDWGRLFSYIILSLVLYYLGTVDALFFLFAVPLQVLYAKRGARQFGLASLIVLVGIGLFAVWRTGQVAAGQARWLLVALEMVADILIVAGLCVVNVEWRNLRRRLYRFLAATGAAGIVSLPLVLMLASNKQVAAVMQRQVSQVVTVLNASFGGGAGASTNPPFNAVELTAYLRRVVLGNFLFMYFLVLTGVWRVGVMFAARSGSARPEPLATFALPVQLLWPILAVWAMVLADRLFHLGAFGYAAWNLAMIGAFLYGLQGVGIVQHLFARYKVAWGIRILLVLAVLFLLILPGVATIVIIAFPILGISELWIRYGRDAVSQ